MHFCHYMQSKERKSNKLNSLNLYTMMKDYYRDACQWQNINLLFPNPKLNSGIIHIIVKTILVLNSVKKILICTISISDHSTWPRVRGVCKVKVCSFYVGLYFIPFKLICNITMFTKKCLDLLTQPHGSRVCVRKEYMLAWCSMLNFLYGTFR